MTKPNGMIGRSIPRPEALRLVAGRGRYTDDIVIPGISYVAFFRSPHAHARIVSIDISNASALPGIVAVLTADDLLKVCAPWETKFSSGIKHSSPEQFALAREEVTWQGEPVVAVVAESRAIAEDALELIGIEWEELPTISSIDMASEDGASKVNSSLSSNCGFQHAMESGDISGSFQKAAAVAEQEFVFSRQTGVTLEPRSIVASFDKASRTLRVIHSHQAPSQMREVFAAQLGLLPGNVKVETPDIGGAFGMKIQAYPDEMAVAAIAVLLARPVKFVADRLESFASDVHAREMKVKGKIAVDEAGRLLGIQVDVRHGMGAFSSYPRSSIGEGMQAVYMVAAPYQLSSFKGSVSSFYQNKVPNAVLRAVGQPIACTVTEQLLDLAARKINLDPSEMRLRNYVPSDISMDKSATGLMRNELSLDRCHTKLLSLMKYAELREERKMLHKSGVYRGIGLAAFLEQTAVGPHFFGAMGIKVSAHEACALSLEPYGTIRCAVSATDQGQGTLTGLRQIVSSIMGVSVETIEMVSGDTDRAPFGGGAWASRGIALGGEAAHRAAVTLKKNILTIAASILQAQPDELDISNGYVVNRVGMNQMSLQDIANAVHYGSHTIPLDNLPSLEVNERYTSRNIPYLTANGIQAAHVEVDIRLGTIKLLNFWVVDDCGTVINPLLVDEQIRGGVVQGIGAALYEECIYSDGGQLENATLVDYIVPMASEMPDIIISHVETPTAATTLGARGVGEAGTVAAAAAIWGAVNDALAPLDVAVSRQPITPEHILDVVAGSPHI